MYHSGHFPLHLQTYVEVQICTHFIWNSYFEGFMNINGIVFSNFLFPLNSPKDFPVIPAPYFTEKANKIQKIK